MVYGQKCSITSLNQGGRSEPENELHEEETEKEVVTKKKTQPSLTGDSIYL